nr:Uncharacterised protein [Klebsiella pneumoniae]
MLWRLIGMLQGMMNQEWGFWLMSSMSNTLAQ